MGVYTFQLMFPRGGEPFPHSLTDELYEAVKSRGLSLASLRFDGHIDEVALLQSHGCVAGIAPPIAVVVSVAVEGRSREDARSTLQLPVADVGRPDVDVVNS